MCPSVVPVARVRPSGANLHEKTAPSTSTLGRIVFSVVGSTKCSQPWAIAISRPVDETETDSTWPPRRRASSTPVAGSHDRNAFGVRPARDVQLTVRTELALFGMGSDPDRPDEFARVIASAMRAVWSHAIEAIHRPSGENAVSYT